MSNASNPYNKRVDSTDATIAGSKTHARHEPDRNEDPISGEPGAHPVGVGLGTAAGGAAAGAAAGMVAGPIGTVAGAIIGGVAGGLAGKAIAEQIDPTEESAYWRDNYQERPYYRDDLDYDTMEPAYRYGWESRSRHEHGDFESARPSLQQEWESYHGNQNNLDWQTAEPAARDAWTRVDERYSNSPGSPGKPR